MRDLRTRCEKSPDSGSRLLYVHYFTVLGAAPAAGRLIAAVIFGGTAALFVAVALAASYAPARRATSIDPIRALKAE